MTVLTWDDVGEREYEFGVDRGVLFIGDTAVAWNGLRSVDDGSNSELKTFYLDGLKYLETVIPGDFVGKLTAFTYPDEFESAIGVVNHEHGLSIHEQPPKNFSLAYRTRVGNDQDPDYGYKIHILYNLHAVPESHTYETVQAQSEPGEFAWSLSGVPPALTGYRPTVHISIDSTQSSEFLMNALENMLYGTDTSDPRLPTIEELKIIFSEYAELVIIDNGDGTWTANDLTDDVIYITMLDADTFQIDQADVTYSDADTYEISTTNDPLP
jgi:hypothetical protein